MWNEDQGQALDVPKELENNTIGIKIFFFLF